MESDNPRIKALNLLKLSSIAYLEAQNYGECSAVAACSEILKEYNSVVISKEYSEATLSDKTDFTPESGLNDIDIDEFLEDLPCVEKLKISQANIITDDDVKAFVAISPLRNGESKINQTQYDTRSERETQANTSAHLNSSLNHSSDIPPFNLTNRRPHDQEPIGPPCKIFAQAPLNEPPVTPLYNKSEMSLFQKLEQQFIGSRKTTAQSIPSQLTRQPESQTPKTNSSYHSCQLQASSTFQPRVFSPPITLKQPSEAPPKNLYPDFSTASSQLHVQNIKKYGSSTPVHQKVGLSKNVAGAFKPPFLSTQLLNDANVQATENNENPLLKGIDKKLLEIIENEVVVNAKEVTWDDIAGLKQAKEIIQEAVILPLLRPDLFQGLRSFTNGILLFGPPGTGKTLIGKCIAAQSEATFLSISASTLTSKWIGEGEKLVRALFAYARVHQPSVIFLDEIDSILKKRSDSEHESSRRLKTEFLIQFDGANTIQENDRVLIIGATNLPQELDDAARRRFTKRLYIPLPEREGRRELLARLLQKNANSMTHQDFDEIAFATEGYSGADLKTLCADASMICLRELPRSQLKNIDARSLRPINVDDFRQSLKRVKATVSQKELQKYVDWNENFGSTT